MCLDFAISKGQGRVSFHDDLLYSDNGTKPANKNCGNEFKIVMQSCTLN